MSMYKDYIENQIDNRFVHETEKGFIVYNTFSADECQLEEIYIKPEYRRQGIAKEFYDFASEHARKLDCKYLKGSIVTGVNMAEESCMCLLKYGYKFWYTDNNIIYLKKEL